MIDIITRRNLQIDDFDFLSAFKQERQRVFFRLLKEVGKGSHNEDCLLINNDFQYGNMKGVFRRYQQKGYGVFYVVNNGGHRKEYITSITAQYGDVDLDKEIIGYESGKRIYKIRSEDEIEFYKQDFLKKLFKFTLEPSIIVETKNGFHFYWLLQNGNRNIDLFEPIQKAIIDRFESDEAITDLNRILRIPNYMHLKDPDNPYKIKCIKFDQLLKYDQDVIIKALDCKLETGIGNSPVVKQEKAQSTQLSKLVDIPNIKTVPTQGFSTMEEIAEYLKSQDISEVLGVPINIGKTFTCAFHLDEHPSAVISQKKGKYKYFCNSPACLYHDKNGLDIIDIVCRMKSFSFYEAIEYLCGKFNIDSPTVKLSKIQEQRYLENLNTISSEQLINLYPNLWHVIRYGIRILSELNQIALENIKGCQFVHEDMNIVFCSNRYVASRTEKNTAIVNKYINLFAVLGLIKKLDEKEIPKVLIEKAKKIAEQKGQMRINFYVIYPFVDVALKANHIAKIMCENGYSSIKTISKSYIDSILGEEAAECILNTPKNNAVSDSMMDLMEQVIISEISKKGYVIIDDIYNNHTLSIKKEMKNIYFKRTIPVVMEKYDFKYQRANKMLKTKFGLKGYSYILYDNEAIA